MKILREFIRNIKYQIKFLSKNDNLNLNYFVNATTNSELKNLMNHHGSDKGGKNNHHNYADVYSDMFGHKKHKVKNILEIGLGSNDVNVPSNMGIKGVPLASLRAWRDFFKNANIYGADIDKKILKNEDRIFTFFVDQNDKSSIKKMFDQIPCKKFDIILDDGLHEFNANINLFENAIDFLDDEGIYIIEDVYYKDKSKFINYLKNKNFYYSIIDIYHKKNIANNIIVTIKKK